MRGCGIKSPFDVFGPRGREPPPYATEVFMGEEKYSPMKFSVEMTFEWLRSTVSKVRNYSQQTDLLHSNIIS
jgi:hypothetical protein